MWTREEAIRKGRIGVRNSLRKRQEASEALALWRALTGDKHWLASTSKDLQDIISMGAHMMHKQAKQDPMKLGSHFTGKLAQNLLVFIEAEKLLTAGRAEVKTAGGGAGPGGGGVGKPIDELPPEVTTSLDVAPCASATSPCDLPMAPGTSTPSDSSDPS